MATRRDKDLPSHPSTSPGGRPRIPEREITTTDVTQHATEVLTDQDFVITAPDDGDFFRHDGSDWVNVSGVPAADVVAGTFGIGNFFLKSSAAGQSAVTYLGFYDANDVRGAFVGLGSSLDSDLWVYSDTGDVRLQGDLVKIEGNTGELLRLNDSSATGWPTLTFYQAGNLRGSILYQDTNDTMRFVVENNVSATFEWYADGDQVMFLHSSIGLQVRAGDIVCENGDVIATV